MSKFPRDQKFVLGDRIETKLLDVPEECMRADYGRDKRGPLLEANLQLEVARHLVRLANQVRRQLFVLAYNLGNFLRQAVLPRAVRHWALTTLREKLINIGAKVVRTARQVIFQMAEVAVPRELFRSILEAIEWLRWATAMSD